MAKSLRSKWRRKCRAVKRERYGQKELQRLKKTLGIEDDVKQDPNIESLADTVNIVDVETLKKQKEQPPQENDDNRMEVDTKKRKFNPRTLRDEHGTYPVWLHPRKIAKMRVKEKKAKQHRTKRNKRK